MNNKTSNQAEFVFVKHITDRDGEIGELYKVGSEFFVVKWARDDADRKPCKHNTTFTEVWECNFKGTVGNVGRDPTYEWLRWHSGKSIMARFVKSRMTSLTQPNRTTIMTHMNNNDLIDESIAILQTMNAEDNAAAIDELRNELERVKGIARDRLATIAELRIELEKLTELAVEEMLDEHNGRASHSLMVAAVKKFSCQEIHDECEASLSPAGNDGLYGAYLRGELD